VQVVLALGLSEGLLGKHALSNSEVMQRIMRRDDNE
jgi:hypothetical protein